MSTPDLIHSATGDRTDDQHLHVVLGPLATTSVGGRLRIAHNPNQGSSAVSSEDTQQQALNLLLGALCQSTKGWHPF